MTRPFPVPRSDRGDDGLGDVGHGHDLVRPYVMTGGRTRAARRDLRLETMLSAVPGLPRAGLPPEKRAVLDACADPISLAEVASGLGLVVGVVAVLAGDLVGEGFLEVHQTNPVEIELDTLYRLIDAVRGD